MFGVFVCGCPPRQPTQSFRSSTAISRTLERGCSARVSSARVFSVRKVARRTTAIARMASIIRPIFTSISLHVEQAYRKIAVLLISDSRPSSRSSIHPKPYCFTRRRLDPPFDLGENLGDVSHKDKSNTGNRVNPSLGILDRAMSEPDLLTVRPAWAAPRSTTAWLSRAVALRRAVCFTSGR